MRRGARASQVVNNFFTFATIIIISVVLTLYVKYFGDEEEAKKNVVQRLQCEKITPTKTKVLNQTLLNKSIKALEKGYYKIEGSYLKALQMESTIEDKISLAEIDTLFIESVAVKPKKDIEKFLKIRYELIEADKKNPKNDKLNAGTLMTSFRINSKEIFRVTTDFKFLYKNAIKQRVDCSIKVYKNHVQNSGK